MRYYFSFLGVKCLWVWELAGLSGFWKGLALCFLIFLFFVFMSGLDFVVHRVLYGYGLWFSFEWAVFYWSVYCGAFVAFGVVVGFAYWLGSGRSRRGLWVGFGLFLSVCLLFVGGLADVVWFVFWGGGLPSDDVVWWWMPWAGLFGFWNSFLQLVLLFGVLGVVVCFWVFVLKGGF